MSIEENKLKKFEEICIEMAKKDKVHLDNEISSKLNYLTSTKIEQYSSKIDSKNKNQKDEIKRDFNKKESELRLEQKRQMIEEKIREQDELYRSVIKKLEEFTYSNEYIDLLKRMVENILSKTNEEDKKTIYIIKKDENKLKNIENVEILPQLEDKYIGGVIINTGNMIIDNTFFTVLEKKGLNNKRYYNAKLNS